MASPKAEWDSQSNFAQEELNCLREGESVVVKNL